MLTEERYRTILQILEAQKTVTVTDLSGRMHVSESTVRRDLNALHSMKKLNKVFGGATVIDTRYLNFEDDVAVRQDLNMAEKERIAQYAAGLIENDDFIFLDAGTTTARMIPHIKATGVIFVTDALPHERQLREYGLRAILIGGELRLKTDALTGDEAIVNLQRYNFTKGFFGTSSICIDSGYTTPDHSEAAVKRIAMARSMRAFVLSDSSKFDCVSAVSFGNLGDASIITSKLANSKYRAYTEIMEVYAE